MNPPITELKDFARYQYENDISFTELVNALGTEVDKPNVINDNQTTVDGNNHPAMQMEYSFKGANNQRHGLEVWTIDRDTGYDFTYTTNEGPAFSDNIPAIREMLNSLTFIPFPEVELPSPPKEPSFMD